MHLPMILGVRFIREEGGVLEDHQSIGRLDAATVVRIQTEAEVDVIGMVMEVHVDLGDVRLFPDTTMIIGRHNTLSGPDERIDRRHSFQIIITLKKSNRPVILSTSCTRPFRLESKDLLCIEIGIEDGTVSNERKNDLDRILDCAAEITKAIHVLSRIIVIAVESMDAIIVEMTTTIDAIGNGEDAIEAPSETCDDVVTQRTVLVDVTAKNDEAVAMQRTPVTSQLNALECRC